MKRENKELPLALLSSVHMPLHKTVLFSLSSHSFHLFLILLSTACGFESSWLDVSAEKQQVDEKE